MPHCIATQTAAIAAAAFAFGNPVEAEEKRFDLGLRAGISVADGEPANDIPGYGIQGRYSLNEQWSIGGAIDFVEYDFEEPAKLIGIAQDPALEPIDAVAEATIISAWMERKFRRSHSPTIWFVGAGLAAAVVDVPDVTGPRADGRRFDVTTEVNTEVIASIMGGIRREFGRRWYAELSLRADQHFADWQIVDRTSGAQGTVDNYRTFGGNLTLGLRW